MSRNAQRILALEVPIIVRLGEKPMPMGEVTSLVPGTIIELPKAADEPLDLLVNNKVIGAGLAVKVSENFGVRITRIGDQASRIRALGEDKPEGVPESTPEESEADSESAPGEPAPVGQSDAEAEAEPAAKAA